MEKNNQAIGIIIKEPDNELSGSFIYLVFILFRK